jgi:hypothetical protein
MTFEETFQQYLDERDPDHHTSMQSLFQWFYDNGKTAGMAELGLSDPLLKATVDTAKKEAVGDCMEIVDDIVQGHRWGNDGSCGVNTAIKSEIKEKFGLEI